MSARSAVSHGAARVVKLGFPDADAVEFAVLQRRFLEIYRASLARDTRLFAGMERCSRHWRIAASLSGIVTNKPGWLTDPLLEELGLRARFACVVSGDTRGERKPHPLPLLHAAKLAGVAPGECIYVGDAERDVQAAHAAGMPALVANYGYLQPARIGKRLGRRRLLCEQPLDLLGWLERERAP